MSESTSISAVSAELRIITAGRTGLENDLRRDESVELIRARTSLDAIGELANPIDEFSPTGTVILVGPDAVTIDEADEFIDAVRQITPDVKVLLVSDETEGGEAFDAVLPVGASTEALWSALGLSARTPEAEPKRDQAPAPISEAISGKTQQPLTLVEDEAEPEKTQQSEPLEVHTRAMRPAKSEGKPIINSPRFEIGLADVLDEAMLAVIGSGDPDATADGVDSIESALRGGDSLKAGLAELRRELGTETVKFVPGEDAKGGEPVRRGGRVFGALHAEGVDDARLTKSASFLASRMALDVQLTALREAAFTDELTGAWNRRFFQRFLDRSIERARVSRQDLSLMIFDIDDFKTYNDRYGHAAGDEILVEVVKLLVTVIRPHDRVCRIGGDEFAVIFADGPREASSRHPASIETIARRFQKQICEHRFPKLGSDAMGTLTISAGLATFPWEAHDSASLIELADQLAMQSKRAGKNVITMGPGADGVCDAMGPEPEGQD